MDDKVSKFNLRKQVCTMEAGETGLIHVSSVCVDVNRNLYVLLARNVFPFETTLLSPTIKIKCVVPLTSYIVYLSGNDEISTIMQSFFQRELDTESILQKSWYYYGTNLEPFVKISSIEQ
jgi:hypothetical protein